MRDDAVCSAEAEAAADARDEVRRAVAGRVFAKLREAQAAGRRVTLAEYLAAIERECAAKCSLDCPATSQGCPVCD